MKTIIILLFAVALTTTVLAQSPEKMSYQAIVRNGANALVANQAIGIRISVLQGSASGSAVYVETQTPTTNANGLVNIEIGTGSVVTGTFASIDWGNGPYFIKTETDPSGGTAYTITGTSQLLSVPYALYAKSAGSATIAAGSIANAQVAAGAGIVYSKLTLTNSIVNGDLVPNSVTTSKIANGSITTSKMADSAVSGLKLLTNAVNNKHIAAAAVTPDKISSTGASSGNSLMYNGTSVAWGNPATRFARSTVTGAPGGTTYNIQVSDQVVGVDVTSGPVTVNLPSASLAGAGKIIIVKNELGNAGTNNITINRSGTDLINASSTSLSITFGTATGSFRLYSDGVSRWHQW